MFLDEPAEARYGFELMRLTGLPSGSLYPILARLEAAGWLASRQEKIEPSAEGRPARRMYQISPHGVQVARAELAALSAELRPPAPGRRRLSPEGGIA